MAEGTFSREDFERMQNELSRMYETQNKITSSLSEYYKQLEKVGGLQRDLNHVTGRMKDSIDKEQNLRRKINSELKKANTLANKRAFLQSKIGKDLVDELKIHSAINKQLAKEVDYINESLASEKEKLTVLNASKAVLGSIGKSIKSSGKYLLRQTGYLLDQNKALKTAELSIGVLSNQSGMFSKNIVRASHNTNLLGVDTKALAEMQQNYSNQVGRAVMLSQDNLEAVAELAKGTMLGAEGAASMSAQMQVFGQSTRETVKYVEDILDMSNTIGLNAEKVLDNTSKGLKMMNRLSFKDGVKGMAKMAADAAKLGYEVESINSTADKLFNPEGAIEMAAQLQVLGGGFAKMADPFTMMYQARNAPDELAKSLYQAAGASAHFNQKTGEFEVAALELHRLKEAAAATGLNYEELANSAKKFAGINMAKTQISGKFDDETREYIANIADLSENGEFVMNIKNENGDIIQKSLKELSSLTAKEINTNIDRIRNEKATLKERAMQSQTFDETFKNIINQFKSTLLPAFLKISDGLEDGLKRFSDWASDNDIFNKISDFSEMVGELGLAIVKLVTNNPIKSLLAIGLFKAAQWVANGRMLALGFNMGARVGGPTSGIKGPAGGLFGKLGKGVGMGKNIGTASRSMGAIGGGLLSAGFSGYDEWSQNSANGMDDSENTYRTAMRGGGAGLGAWGGAALGAAIGTAILPGIGTVIGGALGGIGGGMGGDALGDWGGDSIFGKNTKKHNDFVMRPGQDAVSFTSKDTLVGLKDGGPIQKSFENLPSGGSKSNGKIDLSFTPLRIEFGTLTLKSGNSTIDIDFDKEPILAREISRMVQEEIRKVIGGGKMNLNVI